MLELSTLRAPIIAAPMAGGPSTPALAAAVSNAGGLGFLAAGYKSSDQLGAELDRLGELTRQPFGVNVFVPAPATASPEEVGRYAARLAAEAARWGVAPGAPLHDDDGWAQKIDLLLARPVPVVSFTFGLPDRAVIDALHAVGSSVVVTVTRPAEAAAAAGSGADALVVQGVEAGGHRGGFTDDGLDDTGLLVLLRLVAAETGLPLVAAGGIADGRCLAAVLVAGAVAAQVGTALLRCPEAGTAPVHRQTLREARRTALTRAFTGRTARGLVNGFHTDHGAAAPAAYPEVHHVTAPIRAAARRAGDPEPVNLWAGQGYPLSTDRPAAQVVADLTATAATAIGDLAGRWG
ncbi:MAG: nitronate monooxygenase [Hamadaea sp.]|nr:nitronate monooxygenase [Hamadaea sp.]